VTKKPYELFPPPDLDPFDDVLTEPDGEHIPGDDLVEVMPGEPTPIQPPGDCFRACGVSAVEIVAPAPATLFEVLRLPTCISSKRRDWAWCGASFYLKLGKHEIYLGPDRRKESRPYENDRRRPPKEPT